MTNADEQARLHERITAALSSVILNLEMGLHALDDLPELALATETKFLAESLRTARDAAEEIRAILRGSLVGGE